MARYFSRFKYFTVTLLFLLTTAMSSGGAVFAYSMTNPDGVYHKVYVCKYVGTPGTNERLQTGDNPISVDTHSLSGFTGLGSFFNDAQGRSIAIAWDNGDHTEPSVTMCPPPAPDQVPVPAMPNTYDPCGLANATWIVPANTSTVTWAVVNGHLVATTTSGNVFVGGGTTHDYGLAVDSNTLCPPTEVPVPATPGDVTFSDICGMENDKYTIPSTAHVKYYVNGNIIPAVAGSYSATGTVSVVAIADQGYVLNGTHSWSHEFTDVPCGQVLGETTTAIFTPGGSGAGQVLANTGSSTVISTLVALFLLIAALVVYAFNPKQSIYES